MVNLILGLIMICAQLGLGRRYRKYLRTLNKAKIVVLRCIDTSSQIQTIIDKFVYNVDSLSTNKRIGAMPVSDLQREQSHNKKVDYFVVLPRVGFAPQRLALRLHISWIFLSCLTRYCAGCRSEALALKRIPREKISLYRTELERFCVENKTQ